MDDRLARLLDKAEAAIDRGDLEQGWNYNQIANTALDLRDAEIRELRRMADADAD